MHRFGLIGKNIGYSFSRGYFSEKFEKLGLEDHSYENFDMPDLSGLGQLLHHTPGLRGLNVTIPYKEAVIPLLGRLDPVAEKIGAVNTICFEDGTAVGYNTDAAGFRGSLAPLLRKEDKKALILGTGGASKAVAYVLGELGLEYAFVSRNPGPGQYGYGQVGADLLRTHSILVNCTPLGTFPDIERCPSLLYQFLGSDHLLYDLIYNPPLTAFLNRGRLAGARVKNGLEMLQIQAEKAWELWNR